MIHSLSRDLAAARLELGTPTHEEGITTFARVLVNPQNEVLLKGTEDGVRDRDGKDPFMPRRVAAVIDNENSITLTNEQSGSIVLPQISGVIIGDVILPSAPEDGVYFTITTRAASTINIVLNGRSVAGYDGTVSDMTTTTLETGAVTLAYSAYDEMWHIINVIGTYTFNSGV